MSRSLDNASDSVTLTITMPGDELPTSGETVEVAVDGLEGWMATLHEPTSLVITLTPDQLTGADVEVNLMGYLVTVTSTEGRPVPRYIQSVAPVPRSLRYVPVEIAARSSEAIHAAIVRRVNNRNHTERYTICDRNGKRIVQRPIYADLGDTVTCKQCRAQLEEDGVL